MQTFMPYSDFDKVAKCLDTKRLGKQRVECKVILDLIEGRKDNQWKNHPAVRMWQGFSGALKSYSNAIIREWISRGYQNTMEMFSNYSVVYPDWLDDIRVIQSHRTNLLIKFPEHYSQFGWKSYNIKGYYWPVTPKTKATKKICEQWTKLFEGK